MLDLIEELRSILSRLEAAGIEFAVCGGLAVAIHARPRATLDVDLLLPRDQLERTREAARELGYGVDATPMTFAGGAIEIHRLSKPDPETGDLLSLDLLIVTPALDAVWASRERVRWEHGSLPTVSRKGLIEMKRLRGSGQDLDDIQALEDADAAD